MFCSNCGIQLEDGSETCTDCGTATILHAGGADQTSAAEAKLTEVGQQAKSALLDAAYVVKVLAANPTGGLSITYKTLGQRRAMFVGVVFGIFVALGSAAGSYWLFPEWLKPSFFKFVLVGLAAPIALAASSFLARKVFRGGGSLEGDVFLATAVLVPMTLASMLSGLLGIGNFEVIVVLVVVVACLTIMMLFAGCTRISGIREPLAVLAVPLMILLAGWLTKIMTTALL